MPANSRDAQRALAADLERAAPGAVRIDRLTRILYSTDASNYQIAPFAVVTPRHADEVSAVVAVCAEHNVPITARGGGSSLAGQSIGSGVILDCAPHLHDIAIDPEAHLAKVGPGAVLDSLNRAAAVHGLAFGPDPASADRACLGGVIGTNATGSHSIVHGTAVDHLAAAQVVLADGRSTRLDGPLDAAEVARRADRDGLEGAVYRGLAEIERDRRELIRRRFPRYWRRAGGYHLDRLVGLRPLGPPHEVGLDKAVSQEAVPQEVVPREVVSITAESGSELLEVGGGSLNPLVLLAGSEGTLAIATRLELALSPRPKITGLLIAHFDHPLDPFRAVPALLATRPTAVELVDQLLIDLARQAPGFAVDAAFVQGRPAALLAVEYAGASEAEVAAGMEAGERALVREGFRGPFVRAVSAADQARLWRVRKAGLGLLMRMRGDWKPVAGIEDTAVPPAVLADYMRDVRALLDRHGVRAAFYAHASAGCIHLRPILNLKSTAGVSMLAELASEMVELVLTYGGVNASEHGDGLARSAFNERLFGTEIYELLRLVKRTFDPQGILNPGKIVDAPPITQDLRWSSGYEVVNPSGLRFDYPDDGDFAHAVDQCNGSGVCRKLELGTMCPSYMVTLDERHTTRARANALRAVLDGRMDVVGGRADVRIEDDSSSPAPPAAQGRAAALASDEVADVMDLCIGCKACKTECPSGVDMARLKIEATAAHVAQHGARPRARLFAGIHELDRRLAPWSRWVNWAMTRLWGRPFARLGAWALGIDPDRRFPLLAEETFDQWWRRTHGDEEAGTDGRIETSGDSAIREGFHPRSSDHPTVVFFPDTFTTYHEPHIGRATVSVVEAAGYHVMVPAHRCCGRPALSQGLVDAAMADMRANVAVLAPLARLGFPILIAEPSCASAFRDELPDLLTKPAERADAHLVAAAVRTVDEFVADLPADQLVLAAGPTHALLHVHCHQRALAGIGPSIQALKRVPGLAVTETDAGCCGMAGAFGYEAEHAAISVAMAERKLAPAVRAAGGRMVVAAPGASCRQQIGYVTGRRAVHPVEVVAGCLVGSGEAR